MFYNWLSVCPFTIFDVVILVYCREVKEALSNGEPVVALESTIITHGMPYPANIEMARNMFIQRIKNMFNPGNLEG